jgi:hypothetical protein
MMMQNAYRILVGKHFEKTWKMEDGDGKVRARWMLGRPVLRMRGEWNWLKMTSDCGL